MLSEIDAGVSFITGPKRFLYFGSMKPFSVSVSQDPDREYSRQQPNLPTTILRLQGMLEFQEPRDQHPLVFFLFVWYDLYVF